MIKVHSDEDFYEDRKEALLDIEEKTRQLLEIQSDLGRMVEEQGEKLNTTEFNILEVIDEQEETVDLLEKCETRQNKRRTAWMFFGIGSAAAALTAIGFMKFTRYHL